MKLVRLIKMCLNETYSTVRAGKNLSDMRCFITEALVAASKEIGLEVNAGKIKYMAMSRDQDAGRSHSIKTDSSSFEKWKCSNAVLGNNLSKSKFYSGRN
jgi:hypothetical protein